jgi:hypothetical protein
MPSDRIPGASDATGGHDGDEVVDPGASEDLVSDNSTAPPEGEIQNNGEK